MAAPASPSSSPRLPSPPPIAEDQIGPTSPGLSLFDDDNHGKLPGTHHYSLDNGASRRIRPGTKAEDMAEGPPLVELQDIDSAFQLTEHLKALHSHHTHPPDSNIVRPITAEIAKELCQPPQGTSRDIWEYELCRFLIQKTNAIIVALFQDTPPCSPSTCPEMRASEWQYLCAVHDPPKPCAAIDYCCHTLDSAATTLTSSKTFPSRLGLGSGNVGGGGGGGAGGGVDKLLAQQKKEIKNVFRRVYRIYAHAWFQHREMFWRVEGKTGLYVLFKMVCDSFGIIEREGYTIPAEAEGLEPPPDAAQGEEEEMQTPMLLRRDQTEQERPASGVLAGAGAGAGETTKRHRHTMSHDLARDGNAVIQEEAEPEDEVGSEEREGEEEVEIPPTPAADSPAPVLSPKPGLGRQATALRELATEQEQGQEQEEQTPIEAAPQEEEPMPGMGVVRSDTLKPAKEEEDGGEAAEEGEDGYEDEDEANVTVVEAEEEEVGKEGGESEVAGEEKVQDQAPAEGGDAGKSVGD